VNIKALLFSIAMVAPATCIAAQQSTLRTVYSADAPACRSFYQMLSGLDYCMVDDDCFNSPQFDDNDLDLTRVSFKQVAVNQYGYTQVYIAKPSNRTYSLVYLDKFQGDHNSRLLETWKIDTVALDSLMAQDPHPLPYDEWVKGGHGITRDTLAPEFAQILARSEKVSDDWAPVWMPVFTGPGAAYAVSRECAGHWEFGGYYHCNTVIKVIVKRLSDGRKTMPICEFSRKGLR
jgi:hypothetical protein